MSVDISKTSEWDSLVSGKQLMAADFWTPWCPSPYCRAFKPVFESVASEYPDIKFVKINVDQMPDIASKYGIQGIAVVSSSVKAKKGRRSIGYIPKGNFKKEIERIGTSARSCLVNLSSVVVEKSVDDGFFQFQETSAPSPKCTGRILKSQF